MCSVAVARPLYWLASYLKSSVFFWTRGDSGKCDKRTARHHRKCVAGSIPAMEQTLGTVYRQSRGLLWRGHWLKCCKMSNKLFIAKIRSFFWTRLVSFQICRQDFVPFPGSWHHIVQPRLNNSTLFFFIQTSILCHANKSYCIPHLEQKNVLPRIASASNNKFHPRTDHEGPERE